MFTPADDHDALTLPYGTCTPPTTPRHPRRWYQQDRTILLLFVASALTLLLVVPLGLVAVVLMWRYATWPQPLKWLLTLIAPAPLYVLLAVLGVSGLAGPQGALPLAPPPTLGTVMLTAPRSLAVGAHGTLYVVDGDQILHFAGTGQLLGRLGPTDATIATDRQGNLSFVWHGTLKTVSPRGMLLRQWPVGVVSVVTVDRRGDVYAAGSASAPEELTPVTRYAPTGRVLARWRTRYGTALATDQGGFVYGLGGLAGGDLAKLDPRTGHVLQLWAGATARGTSSYDALAADAQGTIYVGDTRDGDRPFAIQKLSPNGRRSVFMTLNTADELVAGLAIDRQGNMYVLRSSYARPCASNLGLDKLSPQGAVLGMFRSCPAQD